MNEQIIISKKQAIEMAKAFAAAKKVMDQAIKQAGRDSAKTLAAAKNFPGCQPIGESLNTNNPPQGGSGVKF